MTSFMVRILSSVRSAVSALRRRGSAEGAPSVRGGWRKGAHTSKRRRTNLRVENRRPKTVCTGIRMNRTDIPARQDGPITCSSSTRTAATCRGLIHKKCKYKVTCVGGPSVSAGAGGNATTRGAVYLVEPVDVVGQQVHDLSGGRLGEGFAVQTKSLGKNKEVRRQHPTRRRDVTSGWRGGGGGHLPIDHVAQGHADLHPDPLDVVEVEVMEDGEGER